MKENGFLMPGNGGGDQSIAVDTQAHRDYMKDAIKINECYENYKNDHYPSTVETKELD